MPKLVIASIGPASSVQDGGRPGSQRYGLTPSGAMDRLALAAANARAGLGSPYPRPLQAGDELQAAAASSAAERRIELPAASDAPIRIVLGPQDDEFSEEAKALFLASDWKISATSDRMGYRLEGSI